MEEAEKKNLQVRVGLQEKVIQQYYNITYHLQERGKSMLTVLRCKKAEENGTFVISEEEYNDLLQLACTISERESMDDLGILTKGSYDEIKQLKEIINNLK